MHPDFVSRFLVRVVYSCKPAKNRGKIVVKTAKTQEIAATSTFS
jgi:hypothetical protein